MTPRSRIILKPLAALLLVGGLMGTSALWGCGNENNAPAEPADIVADVRNGRYATTRRIQLLGDFQNCIADTTVVDTLEICQLNFTGGSPVVPVNFDCDTQYDPVTGEFTLDCLLQAESDPCLFNYDMVISGTITDTTFTYVLDGLQGEVEGPGSPCDIYIGICNWSETVTAVWLKEQAIPCPPDTGNAFPVSVEEFIEAQVMRSFGIPAQSP